MMNNNFSERYQIVYSKYADTISRMGGKPSESGLARFLGVSQTTTQRWKSYQIPGPESLKTIHDKLGFSYDWLISGEGEMFDDTAMLIAEQKTEIERLKMENCRLTTRLLHDGATGEESLPATAKAAGQE